MAKLFYSLILIVFFLMITVAEIERSQIESSIPVITAANLPDSQANDTKSDAHQMQETHGPKRWYLVTISYAKHSYHAVWSKAASLVSSAGAGYQYLCTLYEENIEEHHQRQAQQATLPGRRQVLGIEWRFWRAPPEESLSQSETSLAIVETLEDKQRRTARKAKVPLEKVPAIVLAIDPFIRTLKKIPGRSPLLPTYDLVRSVHDWLFGMMYRRFVALLHRVGLKLHGMINTILLAIILMLVIAKGFAWYVEGSFKRCLTLLQILVVLGKMLEVRILPKQVMLHSVLVILMILFPIRILPMGSVLVCLSVLTEISELKAHLEASIDWTTGLVQRAVNSFWG